MRGARRRNELGDLAFHVLPAALDCLDSVFEVIRLDKVRCEAVVGDDLNGAFSAVFRGKLPDDRDAQRKMRASAH